MALTLNNFTGFETGGNEEALATTGTPAYEETTVRTGDYALKLPADVVNWNIDPYGAVADAGDDQIFGFWVRFATGVTPSSQQPFFEAREGANPLVGLELDTSGNLKVAYNSGAEDTITTPFVIDVWYRIEVKWQHSASGTLILHIDGSEKLSVSGKDMTAGGTLDRYRFASSSAFDGDTFFDDFYCMSGASTVSDFLGEVEVFGYQANTNSATGDSGDALDTGVWQNLGQTPAASDEGSYTGGIQTGYILCNDTVSANNYRPGPSGGVPTIDGTIQGAKWLHQLKRTNGGATVLYKRFGNNSDTPADPGTIVSVGTAYESFFTVEVGTPVPLSTEVFAHGLGKDGGARDLLCSEIWAFLLHTPPAPPGGAHAGPLVNASRLHSKVGGGLV